MSNQSLTCPHWGVCGGCSLFTEGHYIPYAQQLATKESRVREHLGGFEIPEWRPIVPSPEEWYYRNKMEYAFSDVFPPNDQHHGMKGYLGLRETGKFNRVVDIQTCLLLSPEVPEILRRARAWAEAHDLEGYNRLRFKGDLRYLVIREGKNTGQRLGVLVVSATSRERITEAAVRALIETFQSFFTTFLITYAKTTGDMAQGEDAQILWGPGTMTEKLGDVVYRVSPYSFFQSNTHGAEKLHQLLEAWADTVGGGALIDLYCGSGAIGLALAKRFDRVIGIDTNKGAIEDARFNAEQNNLGNTEFVAEDAQDFLTKLPASKLSVQMAALVVDPPRPGLHPKAMKSLLEINPPRIAYVSCNPESLARDLHALSRFYTITSVQPLDLFPHTPHLETVALLEHR